MAVLVVPDGFVIVTAALLRRRSAAVVDAVVFTSLVSAEGRRPRDVVFTSVSSCASDFAPTVNTVMSFQPGPRTMDHRLGLKLGHID